MFDRLGMQLQRYFLEHAYEILGAALFLLAAFMVAFLVGRAIRFIMSDSFQVEPAITKLAVRLFRFILVVLAIVVVLGEFGVDVTSVIAAFSVLGLAMAFGLRTTMTNFFTGAMISALKPYEVGDEIDAERVKGIVESTNLFSTVVVTDDGTYVSVPNGPMWAKSIKNRSRIRPMRMILEITVDRSATLDGVRSSIIDAFEADATRSSDYATRVKVEDVTESAMVLQASAWYASDAYWVARDRMPMAVAEKLQSLGIAEVTVEHRGVAKVRPKKEPDPEPANDDVF